jgi:chemotaxis protein MotB
MTPPPIIVIKRPKKGHSGHHGGAWKVAYADFVTAMMSLFMVLWLLNSSDKVKKAVGGYFNDPLGKSKDIGNGLQGAGNEHLSVKKEDMAKLKEKLEQAVRQETMLQKFKDNIVITLTTEGLRIELIEGEGSLFFESGSPTPTDAGRDLLGKLAAEIGKMPNKLTIEGHTDSRPYSGRAGYSNWELSADRANAARRLMQTTGTREDQVTQVRGFADESPRNPANTADPTNRRVTMIIQYETPPAAPPPAPTPAAVGPDKATPDKKTTPVPAVQTKTPAAAQAAKPAAQPAVQTTKPAVVPPAKPAAASTTKPAVVQPTKPAVVQPTKPATALPAKSQPSNLSPKR